LGVRNGDRGKTIMWQYLIVMCLITDFNGFPVNKCYSNVEATIYDTETSCKVAAKAADWRLYMETREKNVGLPLIKTACSKTKEGT